MQRRVGKVRHGLPILETREIGLENVKQVIFDAIERASRAK